jgi:type II secretory ATPase GspE/PulE/Tfp pilus assembly ATPase PilB-like protein
MPNYQLSHVDGQYDPLTIGDTPISIGRAKDNILCIEDSALSRYHCIIERAPFRPDSGEFELDEKGVDDEPTPRIRDLGSRNGTKVNGVRVTEAPLRAGDVIKLGGYTFQIDAEDTLKERQSAAREAAPASQLPWVTDLTTMINMLPPHNEGVSDLPELIDGRGKASSALAGDGDGSRAIRLLLIVANKSRASDVHVEPKGEFHQVRMRVDGQMVDIVNLPNTVGELSAGLIKTACQFRQTQREAVLDGRYATRFPHSALGPARRVDYRVSFTPSIHGPKLVLRVLDQRDAPRSLADLGLAPYWHERIRKVTAQDAGLLLVCGPTGSGKTTTLYNALREIDRDRRNVVTIEDPVEYQLDKVTQIPVDDAKGNSFGGLLRSVLRGDPDVILVGEVRDEETARTAMQAAMTGHLVFSTVHAKDTMSSVFRLLDLKVEPYLVANSLEIILAQRLVRVLCENCKRSVRVSPGQATRMGKFLENQTEVCVATGCAACLRTGYRGRKAIYELLDFTDELRDVVMKDPSISSMKRIIELGMFTTLVQSGWLQVARGVTTMEEVDRVASTR